MLALRQDDSASVVHYAVVAVPLLHRSEQLLHCLFAVLVPGHAVFVVVASAWETKSLVFSQESRLGAAIDIGAVWEVAA